jgi:hypothetical protein
MVPRRRCCACFQPGLAATSSSLPSGAISPFAPVLISRRLRVSVVLSNAITLPKEQQCELRWLQLIAQLFRIQLSDDARKKRCGGTRTGQIRQTGPVTKIIGHGFLGCWWWQQNRRRCLLFRKSGWPQPAWRVSEFARMKAARGKEKRGRLTGRLREDQRFCHPYNHAPRRQEHFPTLASG